MYTSNNQDSFFLSLILVTCTLIFAIDDRFIMKRVVFAPAQRSLAMLRVVFGNLKQWFLIHELVP
jgi:hypothetical protein